MMNTEDCKVCIATATVQYTHIEQRAIRAEKVPKTMLNIINAHLQTLPDNMLRIPFDETVIKEAYEQVDKEG